MGKRGQVNSPEGINQYSKGSARRSAIGLPGVVYHGSPVRGLKRLVPQDSPRNPLGRAAIFATGSMSQAYGYAKKGGQVYPVHMNLRNPLDTTKLIKAGQRKGLSFGDAKRSAWSKVTAQHDGVVFRGNGANPPEFAAFGKFKVRILKGLK